MKVRFLIPLQKYLFKGLNLKFIKSDHIISDSTIF
jgi:hypothetical protein